MIRIPKEVEKAMKSLENSGFECYAAGECVIDAVVNLKPLDWDVVTDASIDDLTSLFPEGRVINRRLGVIRLEFGDIEDDGIILDISHYRNGQTQVITLNEDLEGRVFTCNAIGESLSRTPVDPFGGRRDIREKSIRTIGIVDKVFEESPETMLEMVRIAGEMGFKIPKDALDAIRKCGHLLLEKNHIRVQKELLLLADSYNVTECYRILRDTGLMNVIMGKPIDKKLALREKSELDMLLRNLTKSEEDAEVRLALLYLCFDSARTRDAIRKLDFQGNLGERFVTLHEEINTSYTVNDKLKMKSFINRVGMENYIFIQKVAVAKKTVFNERFDAAARREVIMRQIKNGGEVITRDDIPLDEAKLMDLGIVTSIREGEELIARMVDASIKENFSKESDFEALARNLAENKRKFPYKGIKWIRK